MNDDVIFIGDVHGEIGPLVKLVGVAKDAARQIVFLGDYVNRGKHSREVLEFLVELQHELGAHSTFLRGHHDAAFLGAIEGGQTPGFLRMGGAATLRQYPRRSEDGSVLQLSERVPARQVEFLRSLQPHFDGEGCFAAHSREDATNQGIRFGVFGHSPQDGQRPYVTDRFALIDTGCGTREDGRLTGFMWPSRKWIQAD